jgi:hypothetical protein
MVSLEVLLLANSFFNTAVLGAADPRIPVTILDSDADQGVRDNDGHQSYDASIDITTNAACLFIVHRQQTDATMSPGTIDNSGAALTVGGVSATKIFSSQRELATGKYFYWEIYYLPNVSTGTNVTCSAAAAAQVRVISVHAFMLDSNVQPTVTQNNVDVNFDGTSDTVDVSANKNSFVFFKHASENYITSFSLNVTRSYFADGVRGGLVSGNGVFQASEILDADATVTATLVHTERTNNSYPTDYFIVQF